MGQDVVSTISVTKAIEGLLTGHLAHLRTSGLTDETIARAGIKTITSRKDAQAICGMWLVDEHLPAICFPLWNVNGEQEPTGYLRPDKPRLNLDNKPVKYESPRGKKSRAYFSPLTPAAAWLDKTQPIIVTEGVKKALALGQIGVNVIALPGVWMAHDVESRKRGLDDLHPDLKDIPWEDRVVLICFDSDVEEKDGVRKAEAFLASLLQQAGAKVWLVRIPSTKGGPKLGIDDYLVQQPDPKAAWEQIPRIEPAKVDGAADYKARKAAADLNDRFAYVASQNRVFDRKTGVWLTLSGLAASNIHGAAKWADIDYALRRTSFMTVDFAPGRTLDRETLNLYDPSRMLQYKGSALMPTACPDIVWRCVLNIAGNDKKVANYLLDRVAYTIQHPGQPMTGLILQGPRGTGKTSYTDLVYALTAPYSTVLSQTQLQGQFNDWLARSLTVIVPEARADSLRDQHAAEMYLSEFALAGTPVLINGKNAQPYQITSAASFILCTNYDAAIPLAQDDRRWNVVRGDTRMDDLSGGKELGKVLWESKRDPAFLQELFNHLHERDVSAFAPMKILDTEARRDMLAASRSPTEVFWAEVQSPEGCIPKGTHPSSMVYAAYTHWCMRNGHKQQSKNTWGRSVPKDWRGFTDRTKTTKAIIVPDFGQRMQAGWEDTSGLFPNPTADGTNPTADGMRTAPAEDAVRAQPPVSTADPKSADGTDGSFPFEERREQGSSYPDPSEKPDFQKGILPSAPSAAVRTQPTARLAACSRCGSVTPCWAKGCRPMAA